MVELHDLYHRLLILNFQVASKSGKIDRDFINWLVPLAQKYEKGAAEFQDMASGFLKVQEKLQEMSDNDYEQYVAAARKQASEGLPILWFPEIDAPYTRISAASADDFEPEFAGQLLDIPFHIQVLRDTRENLLYYQRLTFLPDLTTENHTRAVEMAEFSTEQMTSRARIIAQKIDKLE